MNRSPMETVGLERGKTVGQSELDEFRSRMDAKLPRDVRLMKFHRLILVLLSQGGTAKQIAQQLHISVADR